MTVPVLLRDNPAQTPPNGEPAQLPIIVAEWPRNSRELVRIALDRYNKCFTIDIRSWWRDPDGNWRPGRCGLTLAVKHLPALANGLVQALQRAQALYLIEPTTSPRTGPQPSGNAVIDNAVTQA